MPDGSSNMTYLSSTLILCVILCVFISSGSTLGCNGPYKSFGNNCYHLVTFTKASWNNAEQSCQRQGGHLVSVTTQDEYLFIRGLIQNAPQARDVWIGLSHENPVTSGSSVDVYRQGWKWSDGSTYSYSDWQVQEPGPGDKFARIENYQWVATGNADEPHHYMCEQSDPVEDNSGEDTSTLAPGPAPLDSRDERAEPSTSSTTQSSSTTTTTTTPSTTVTITTMTPSTPSSTSPTTTQSSTATTMTTTISTTPSTTTTTTQSKTTTPLTSTTTTSMPTSSTMTLSTTSTKSTSTKSTLTTTSTIPTTTLDGSQNSSTKSSLDSPGENEIGTPRIHAVNHPEPNRTRNIGIIVGCVLGFIFIVILGVIFFVLGKSSRFCSKKEDLYEEPLKSTVHGTTEEELVGDMLTQGNGNVYIEMHARQKRGNIDLGNAGNTPSGYANGEVNHAPHYENRAADDNVYDSITDIRNPSTSPNPYYNT